MPKLFQLLFERTADACLLLESGVFTDCNPAAVQMLRCANKEQVLALHPSRLSPQYQPDGRLSFEKANEMIALALKQGTHRFEWMHRRLDGEDFWVEVLLTVIPLEDRQILYTVWRDISDRKAAEAALRESLTLYESLANALPQCLFRLDRAGRFTFGNQAFLASVGLSLVELQGKIPSDLYPLELAAKYAADNERVMQSGELLDLVEEHQAPTAGRRSYVQVVKVPIHNSQGEVIGLQGIFWDISDRWQAEIDLRHSESQLRVAVATAQAQAQELTETLQELQRAQTRLVQSEKMSSLGQLVAGVAHEINNPVNFIYGNLSHIDGYVRDIMHLLEVFQQQKIELHPDVQATMEEIDLPFLVEDLPKLVASIKLGAERIQQIVSSLRSFSRTDEAECKPVNLHEGLDSTLLILQSRLKDRPDRPGIQVIKNYGLLTQVDCYAGQLNQVFMNILSNAIDALEERDQRRTRAEMQQQPSQITIETELAAGWAKIRIKDNGPGMTEAIQQQMFDPFFTTKAVGKGTGLGMSISYQIVTERHGGSLRCLSQLGQGTEFVIEIPLLQPEPPYMSEARASLPV